MCPCRRYRRLKRLHRMRDADEIMLLKCHCRILIATLHTSEELFIIRFIGLSPESHIFFLNIVITRLGFKNWNWKPFFFSELYGRKIINCTHAADWFVCLILVYKSIANILPDKLAVTLKNLSPYKVFCTARFLHGAKRDNGIYPIVGCNKFINL